MTAIHEGTEPLIRNEIDEERLGRTIRCELQTKVIKAGTRNALAKAAPHFSMQSRSTAVKLRGVHGTGSKG